MNWFISLIVVSFTVRASQTTLSPNIELLLTITRQRVEAVLNPSLQKIAQENKKNQGQLLCKLREHYGSQKTNLWSYIFQPCANQKKMIAYFQFMAMHDKNPDLTFQELTAIYWPIISAHSEYTSMAENLAHEHTYGQRLLYGSNVPAPQTNFAQSNPISAELKKFSDHTLALLGSLSNAQSLTDVYYQPAPSQEELLLNPTFSVTRALHSIYYKNALERINALVPLYKINRLFQYNNRGASLFHFLIEQKAPIPLFKSLAKVLVQKYQLEIDEEDEAKRTPLAYAVQNKSPQEIIATIQSLSGILQSEKTVQFTV